MMENQDFINLVIGVAANALTAIFAHVGRKGKAMLDEKDELRKLLEADTSLERILRRAITDLAKTVGGPHEVDLERFKVYLHSPDVEAIFRQMYSCHLNESTSHRVMALETEFLLSLSLFV